MSTSPRAATTARPRQRHRPARRAWGGRPRRPTSASRASTSRGMPGPEEAGSADIGEGGSRPVRAVGVDVPLELRAERRAAHAVTPAGAPGGAGAVLHALGVVGLVRGDDAESHAEPCGDDRPRAERNDRDPLRARDARVRVLSRVDTSGPLDGRGGRRSSRDPLEVKLDELSAPRGHVLRFGQRPLAPRSRRARPRQSRSRSSGSRSAPSLSWRPAAPFRRRPPATPLARTRRGAPSGPRRAEATWCARTRASRQARPCA